MQLELDNTEVKICGFEPIYRPKGKNYLHEISSMVMVQKSAQSYLQMKEKSPRCFIRGIFNSQDHSFFFLIKIQG